MTTYGVDVSKWQDPPLNWDGMRDNKDIRFMFARASLGLIPDSTYPKHVAQAAKAGLEVGAYHYLWPNVVPAQAVELFHTAIGPLVNQHVALDVEEKGTTWAMVKAWVREWDRQTNNYPISIYISRGFWVRINKPRLADFFDHLWLAYWPGGGYPGDGSSVWDSKLGGFKPTIWQYGVRRASGRKLDGNAFRGSVADYRALITSIDLPDTSTGGFMTVELDDLESALVQIKAGTPLYDLNESLIRNADHDVEKTSHYGVVGGANGSKHYRVINIKAGGSQTLALVQLKDITMQPIPDPVQGATPEEVEAAVADAIARDRASATVGIIYPQENA